MEAGIETVEGGAGIGMNGWCWLGWLMLMADTIDVGIETPAESAGSWGTAGMAGVGMALKQLALVLLLRKLEDSWG